MAESTGPGAVVVTWGEMDEFAVRRRGVFHWQVVCIAATDGIEREAAGGARFWRAITAERVARGMNAVMMQAIWRAQAHPYQHGAVPVVAVGGALAPAGATTPRAGQTPPGARGGAAAPGELRWLGYRARDTPIPGPRPWRG